MKHGLRRLPALLLALTALAVQPARAQEATTASEPDETSSAILSPAYPNPFNPTTQFTLQVPRTQEVRVEVFNLLGQRVRLLHDGPLEAGEARAFTFEAADLPSGLYLYRAQGDDFVVTRQVTLLK